MAHIVKLALLTVQTNRQKKGEQTRTMTDTDGRKDKMLTHPEMITKLHPCEDALIDSCLVQL